jgi:hypothetical protein
VPFVGDTGNYSGQFWKLTSLARWTSSRRTALIRYNKGYWKLIRNPFSLRW